MPKLFVVIAQLERAERASSRRFAEPLVDYTLDCLLLDYNMDCPERKAPERLVSLMPGADW